MGEAAQCFISDIHFGSLRSTEISVSHPIILGEWNYMNHSSAHACFKRRSFVTPPLFSTSRDHRWILGCGRFEYFLVPGICFIFNSPAASEVKVKYGSVTS